MNLFLLHIKGNTECHDCSNVLTNIDLFAFILTLNHACAWNSSFESTLSRCRLNLKASRTVSEVVWTLIQESWIHKLYRTVVKPGQNFGEAKYFDFK